MILKLHHLISRVTVTAITIITDAEELVLAQVHTSKSRGQAYDYSEVLIVEDYRQALKLMFMLRVLEV